MIRPIHSLRRPAPGEKRSSDRSQTRIACAATPRSGPARGALHWPCGAADNRTKRSIRPIIDEMAAVLYAEKEADRAGLPSKQLRDGGKSRSIRGTIADSR